MQNNPAGNLIWSVWKISSFLMIIWITENNRSLLFLIFPPSGRAGCLSGCCARNYLQLYLWSFNPRHFPGNELILSGHSVMLVMSSPNVKNTEGREFLVWFRMRITNWARRESVESVVFLGIKLCRPADKPVIFDGWRERGAVAGPGTRHHTGPRHVGK